MLQIERLELDAAQRGLYLPREDSDRLWHDMLRATEPMRAQRDHLVKLLAATEMHTIVVDKDELP
jgi:hypothetical protein